MSREAFDVINDFCKGNGKNDLIRNLAVGVYEQQFLELVSDWATQRGNVPTQAETATMKETLLSKNSLSAHVKLAEEMFREECLKEVGPLLKREGWKAYWVDVSSNIVASLLYSLLLIIIFVVAQDQIATWLSSLQANGVDRGTAQEFDPRRSGAQPE